MDKAMAHLTVRCQFNKGELVDILSISPSFSGPRNDGDPVMDIARDKNLVYAAVYNALIHGKAAQLDWGDHEPHPNAPLHNQTLSIQLDGPGETVADKVDNLRNEIANGTASMKVIDAKVAGAKNQPPIRPISFMVRMHALGKPNPIEFTIAAKNAMDAVELATQFFEDNRPDIQEGSLICSAAVPSGNDFFLVANQPFPDYDGFSNQTTAKLYEALVADSYMMDMVNRHMDSERGIAVSKVSSLAAPASKSLRSSFKTRGPINWQELTGKLEEHAIGRAIHKGPQPKDSRQELLKEIETAFEWRPEQKAILELLEPKDEVIQRTRLPKEALSSPDIQAKLANRMLVDLRKGTLNDSLYQPSEYLQARMNRLGIEEMDSSTVYNAMHHILTPEANVERRMADAMAP